MSTEDHTFPLPRAELDKLQKAVGDEAQRLARLTDECVRANPWEATALACLAGLMFGIWLGTRR